MTSLCGHKMKTQWSVWPTWLVLVKFIAVSMLICLRSNNSFIRLDLEKVEEELFQKSGKKQEELEVFQWKLLALWKSDLPQHFHDVHYANFFSTILSLKSLNMEGRGEISTTWIICARV